MTKNQFLAELECSLSGLPEEDVRERLEFFGEMIDDNMDEGLTEEQAVAKIGSVESVVAQILEDTPLAKLVKEKIRPKRRMAAWEIVLLAVGSPIWLSLIIVAFAVLISLYAAIWSVIVSLWAAFVAISVSAFGGIIGGIVIACMGNTPIGLLLIGCALVLAGLSIFAFWGCRGATKGAAWLTKKLALAI